MASTKLKLPQKHKMNLYQPEVIASKTGKDNRKQRILLIVGIALFVVLIAFGVVGRYLNLNNKKAELANAKAELETYEAQLALFPDLESEHSRYSKSFMTKQEKALEKKGDIINVINAASLNIAEVSTIAVTNNVVSVELLFTNLDNVAKVRKNLENTENTSDVRVYTADRSDSDGEKKGKISASIVFNYGETIQEEEEAAAEETTDDSTEE